MQRRKFLKNLLSVPVIGGGMMLRNPLTLAINSAQAGSTQSPVLVVIFMRGGNDGLNTLIPYGENRYYDLRPNIAIPTPGSGAGSAIDLDGFFGFHPALAPLKPLYQLNELALMPAVHYPNATRSHFEIQALLEGGAINPQSSGWLNRYLAATSNPVSLRAAAVGDKVIASLQGSEEVPVVSSRKNAFWGSRAYKEQLPQQLQAVYSQTVTKTEWQSLYQAGTHGLDVLDLLHGLDPDSYTPTTGVQYPETSFGNKLKRLAQIIKSGMGLEVAALDCDGWDSHARQGGSTGNHANKLAEYAQGVSAFYQDLWNERQNLLVLTMTDFGRTARENGSKGTDHGNASTWMALGGNVTGGIHGAWPGLADEQLYLGRYLAHTIDFRDILGEVLQNHLKYANPDSILAGHAYNPVGFL